MINANNHDIYIIAEIANAAQGVAQTNFELILAARDSGANAVKFQLYKYDELCVPSYPKYDIYVKTFYSAEDRKSFINYAKSLNIDVCVDIFDRWGLEVAQANIDNIYAIKIPPTVVLDKDLVEDILKLNKPTSIGIAGYDDNLTDDIVKHAKTISNTLSLMYGFQAFPTPEGEVSLSRIKYLKHKYGLPIGFADHTSSQSEWSLSLPEYAYFCGASIIEKHISLNSKEGLDHYSSLEPADFKNMVRRLRECVSIYGTLNISKSQKEYLNHATRATASCDINTGDTFTKDKIKYKRVGEFDALLPPDIDKVVPCMAICDIKKYDAILPKSIRKAKVGNVVLCRMHSKRLPKKAILPLGTLSAIERCIKQCQNSKSDITILASSSNAEDAILSEYADITSVPFFKGSEDDVAQRILSAAEEYELDIIVRVTGDSPFISYELIDYLVNSHCQNCSDYSYYDNASLGTRPEAFSTSALKKLIRMIDTSKYSEYLSLFFKNNAKYFNTNIVQAPNELSGNFRLNLDYPEDYDLLSKLSEMTGIPPVPLTMINDIMNKNIELSNINSKVKPVYLEGEFAEKIKDITTIKGK